MKNIVLILMAVLFCPFLSSGQNRYDVVIDEIMPDPSPVVGLPANEWIELRNTTAAPVNLQGWRIGDATGISGPMPAFILQPDSFVIVCTGSAVAAMSVWGPTISVTGFPSLDNDGDRLFLRAANGPTIHALSYAVNWYQNTVKAAGGWSLEMINPQNPCAGRSNWKASTDSNGGTPGKKNSADGVNNDTEGPHLLNAYTTDPATILLVFDEPVDSLKGATLTNYSIDGGLSFTAAVTLAPLFNTVQLKTGAPLSANTVYQITVSQVTDCKNNTIAPDSKTRVGLPADAAAGELIINEILFNPRSNGFDYAELYNRSNKIFDANKLYIATRNSSRVISSQELLSAVPWYIFPGDYLVVTEDAASLALHYLVKNPPFVSEVSSLPSYPDDEGYVIALNFQGEPVDEVHYKDDWHFKLIADDEGVALERVDPEGPSQDAQNWHSAASTAGYGTPGYKNSQYKRTEPVDAMISITPKVFSPDNDGRDDIATIGYQTDEPGFVANVHIYDGSGRLVRHLVKNATLALNGYWNWDGLDEKGAKLPVGIYVVFTEIFNLQGKKQGFKNTIVLARLLK